MDAPRTHDAIRAIFRAESPKIIAFLARRLGDVGLAEELAQDAIVAALEQWPKDGVPENPGAWLVAAARNRAVNERVRRAMARRKHEEIAREMEAREVAEPRLEDAMDDDIGDDLLRLVFTACHPVLSMEARVALTLRLLGGLETDEIARAFLVPEATIAQRIVRAKKTLAEKNIPFEVPRAAELDARLAAVLTVVYLVFNEGYAATSGNEAMRPALCEDALRLARTLVRVLPRQAEVHGLFALMRLTDARAPARLTAEGDTILLADQDRGRWDRTAIEEGLAAIAEAEALAEARGPFTLQAAIAACHARAASFDATDWARIAALYEELEAVQPSPIVALNRAVAVARAEGPARGLALLDRLAGEPLLARYHRLAAARADLLERLERFDEARAEFERAAEMTENERERLRLFERAAGCARRSGSLS